MTGQHPPKLAGTIHKSKNIYIAIAERERQYGNPTSLGGLKGRGMAKSTGLKREELSFLDQKQP